VLWYWIGFWRCCTCQTSAMKSGNK
jgi:hypothetical protein